MQYKLYKVCWLRLHGIGNLGVFSSELYVSHFFLLHEGWGSNTNQNRFPNASSYIFGIKMFQIPLQVCSSYIYHVVHYHAPLPFLENKAERTSGHFYITCWLDPHAPYDKWNCVTKVKWTILEARHAKRCRAFASSKSFRIELSRLLRGQDCLQTQIK
jgi:hypothetical protein